MRQTAFACAALAAIVLVLSGCRSGSAIERTQRLDQLLSDLHQRGLFDGAVVVADDKRVLYAKGFGYANFEKRVAFTPDTAADGGSLAKTFTAALVIAMDHDGILDLDAPVTKLLPELPYDGITLRHLLSHSSGVPVLDYDYFDQFLPGDRVRTTEVLLTILAAQHPPLATAPGTSFEYSSFGYDLAALAAARAGGKPYFELLSERLLGPLGIASAFARPGHLAEFPGTRTLGYRYKDGTLELHDVFENEAFHGGSNLYISANDLTRWNLSFFRAPANLAETTEAAKIGGAPSALTLGSWYSTPDRSAYWYSGHLRGFHSEVFRDMRGRLSIVYMSNNTIAPWLQKRLVHAIDDTIRGRDVTLRAPLTDTVSKPERPSVAGRWRLADGGEIDIESRGERVDIDRKQVRYRVVQIAPDYFYVPGLDYILGFSRDHSAELSKIYVSTNVGEQWGTRER